MANNRNLNLADSTGFPEVDVDSLSTFNGATHPVLGVPGFIVVTRIGAWAWFGNINEALSMAGTEHAVYAATECGAYFEQFDVPHDNNQHVVNGKVVND